MGQRTTFDFRGQWTRGVLSHDVAWGPLYAAKHGVSQEGAEASVYVPFAPSAWVAAASRHVTHTEGDALGFFTPESRFSFGETDWSCSRNGSPCDLTARFESVYDLQATEPSTWDFRINASARLSSSPGYYLSLIEFPDDTWIR